MIRPSQQPRYSGKARLSGFLGVMHDFLLRCSLHRISYTVLSASRRQIAPDTQLRKALRYESGGYTLPELLAVMAVSLLFSALIVSFGFTYWRDGNLMQADQDTLISRLNTGDFLRENIGNSSGLVIQNSIPDPNALVPDPADATNQYWKPIHAIPGNTPIGASGTYTPLVYFRRLSTNSSNVVIMNGLNPYEDEYVLYLNGATKQLLVRSIANPNASGNRLKTSCPPAMASATCPEDRVISNSVISIDMRYFSRSGNLIDYTSIYDSNINQYMGPDFPVVEVTEFTLNLQQKPTFFTNFAVSNRTVIRIALRNS